MEPLGEPSRRPIVLHIRLFTDNHTGLARVRHAPRCAVNVRARAPSLALYKYIIYYIPFLPLKHLDPGVGGSRLLKKRM